MKNPRVSILLPYFNEGTWLKQAIDSICNQSFKNWELLLIANNADQQSLAIASEESKYEPRIRLLYEEKKGIAHALNLGLMQSSSDLVCRMDADDYALPERLKIQVDFLEQHSDIGLVSTQTGSHPEGLPGEGFRYFMDWQNKIESPDDHRINRFIESPLAHPTVLFRRSLIERYGFYDTAGIPEDYEIWLRWMQNGVNFYKIQQPLLLWRDHPNRLSRESTDYSSERFLHVKIAYIKKMLDNMDVNRPVILCGASRKMKMIGKVLAENGIVVAGYTDVVRREIEGAVFIPANEIPHNKHFFYLSFIATRGKSDEIRSFLGSYCLKEEIDFLIAG